MIKKIYQKIKKKYIKPKMKRIAIYTNKQVYFSTSKRVQALRYAPIECKNYTSCDNE